MTEGGGRASELVAALKDRGETVATAESLTAGLLSATIAGVPGASTVLRGGLIVYATDLKATLAGVSADTLDTFGPVSGPTARELAEGARDRCGADWGVSLTGVAGPDRQDGHDVGEVWLGVAAPDGTATTHLLDIQERDRNGIREESVAGAVVKLLLALH